MLTIGIIIGLVIIAPVVIACIFHTMLCISLGRRERGQGD